MLYYIYIVYTIYIKNFGNAQGFWTQQELLGEDKEKPFGKKVGCLQTGAY